MRLFIAVLVPEDIKAEIESAQAQLRRALPEGAVRWAKREQFHLTLRFLGSVEPPRVPALTEAVRAACQNFAALSLRAEGIGCFPDARFPRVVWVGVADLQQQLPRLQTAVQVASQEFTTEKPEDRFTGHVTLGRIKKIKRPESEALAKATTPLAQRTFGEWTVGAIHIMQSELSPQGARHSILAPIPLL
jgi:RNA 2',3'-cyclic 3'-phosphodiesterase